MSLTCGFYPSLNGDRKYGTVDLSRLFDGIINDGVFMSIGDALMVKPGGGTTILVGAGRAWFHHSWTYNDADLPIVLEDADVTLNRIDTVIHEVDASESVRQNSIKVITGAASSSPERPALTNSDDICQTPLAYIYRPANSTEITAANITNVIGTSECPFVTGILETIETDALIVQWHTRFEELFAQLETSIEQAVGGTIIDASVTTSKLANQSVTPSKIYSLYELLLALVASGPLVLTPGVHYGTEEPSAGVEGQLFLVEITE